MTKATLLVLITFLIIMALSTGYMACMAIQNLVNIRNQTLQKELSSYVNY